MTTFNEALNGIKAGMRYYRKGWNGKSIWIRLYKPDFDCPLTHPFLVIEYPVGHPAYPEGSCIPWLASQTDILADDWELYE